MHLQDLNDQQWASLKARQENRESLALAEGARRFREQIAKEKERGDFARSPVARKLMKYGIEPLEQAIIAWVEQRKSTRGPKHTALPWIERVGADVAAYMTLKVVLDGITKRREYTAICYDVADLILDELRYQRLKEQAPGLFEYKLKRFRTASYSHMARSMDHAVRTAQDQDGNLIDTSDLQMTSHQRLHVGAKLVELLVEHTGTGPGEPLVVPELRAEIRNGRRKTTQYLEATETTNEWLTEREDKLARSFLQAQNIPMVMTPSQWAPGKRGGFLYALKAKHPAVRGIYDQTFRVALENANMPLVFDTINALQNTAWRINRAVYDVVRLIEQNGGGFAGIPLSEPLPEPPRPADIDTNEEARKQWRKKAGPVKDQNHIRTLRAREIQRVLGTAAVVMEEDAIFFPYSMDFRGRIYPIADYLHPQGNDLAKALLMFSQGKALDEDGARWLAIHGANCLGETPEGKVSKMTLDERVEWVHEHTRQIMRVADHPLSDRWWTTADDPLQFYAFCVEWAKLIRANQKGEDHICALPISMDGSCNGLQHFSAMLRDEIGGAAVNVLPQTRPQDIYQRVADVVLDKLEELAPSDPLAAKLLGSKLVTRKLTKRPTMTFGYGSKRFGFKQQLKDYLRGLDQWHEVKALLMTTDAKTGKDKSQLNAACALLAKLIAESLGEIVVKAAEGMKWMQKCARGVVRKGKMVEWVVPVTGFVVRQEYVHWRRQQINTILAGKLVRPRIYVATDKLDPIKQANAISPNVVHSLDAAALMLTVSQAAAEGVESFAMVHDSYGTLPADCSVLARCCRQSFVRLYTSQDVVTLLSDQFIAQGADPEKCPIPSKGSLEVNGVLASDYFFA